MKIDDHNPQYPALPAVNKWRSLAKQRELTAEEKYEYGTAVLEEIGKLNRAALLRSVPTFKARCASGSFCNDPKELQKIIRRQHIEDFAAAVARDQTQLVKFGYFEAAYEKAMREKRAYMA